MTTLVVIVLVLVGGWLFLRNARSNRPNPDDASRIGQDASRRPPEHVGSADPGPPGTPHAGLGRDAPGASHGASPQAGAAPPAAPESAGTPGTSGAIGSPGHSGGDGD